MEFLNCFFLRLDVTAKNARLRTLCHGETTVMENYRDVFILAVTFSYSRQAFRLNKTLKNFRW